MASVCVSAAAWPSGGRWRLALAGVAATACIAVAQAQDEPALKAAIVVNMLQFVQWPADDSAPLVLCADRTGALWPHLANLQGKPVRSGRTLVLQETPATADKLRGCAVWLLEASSTGRRAPAGALAGQPVLVIGDTDLGDEAGVVIALRQGGQRVAFEVDLQAARRNGLQVSSKLLKLAAKVSE